VSTRNAAALSANDNPAFTSCQEQMNQRPSRLGCRVRARRNRWLVATAGAGRLTAVGRVLLTRAHLADGRTPREHQRREQPEMLLPGRKCPARQQ
jgi:hypothetical protein